MIGFIWSSFGTTASVGAGAAPILMVVIGRTLSSVTVAASVRAAPASPNTAKPINAACIILMAWILCCSVEA
jgi:hypothetical protein